MYAQVKLHQIALSGTCRQLAQKRNFFGGACKRAPNDSRKTVKNNLLLDAAKSAKVTVSDADSVLDDDGEWRVRPHRAGLLEFQQQSGVRAVQRVFHAMKCAKDITKDKTLWDNFGYREFLLQIWLRERYGFHDLRRSKGRSGPDCVTDMGKRYNIEMKTSKFSNRKRFTAAYEVGQFCRQNTPQICAAVLTIDTMVYGVFKADSVTPLLVFCLHSDQAIDNHADLMREKQKAFNLGKRKREEETQKGGRDTCKITGGDLCRILSANIDQLSSSSPNNTSLILQPVGGFDVWLKGQYVDDWHAFAAPILFDKGIELL